MKYKSVCFVFLCLFLASCSNKMYFTYDMKKRLDYYDLDVERVQFYNSQKIVLTRVVPHDDARIVNGEIKLEDGQFVEEIIIKRNTPGACRLDEEAFLGVSFEQGDNKIISFVLSDVSDYYEIEVIERGPGAGKIIYDSLLYNIDPNSEMAKLLVRKDDKYIYQINQRVAKGVLVR